MAKFVFRSNQTIGAAAAESDHRYLSECFVDTGALPILQDCDDHRRLLIARTGAGKSALLLRLAGAEPHVIGIEPESLSLTHISNSTILKYFWGLGVNLEAFYKLLWRHVLVVEILKEKFQITTEEKQRSFLDSLWRRVTKNKRREKALVQRGLNGPIVCHSERSEESHRSAASRPFAALRVTVGNCGLF